MTVFANREANAQSPRPRAAPTVSAGDIDQRLARGRSRTGATNDQRAKSPIRTWRSADAEMSKADHRAQGSSATSNGRPARQHRVAASPIAPRPNGPDRMARMRVVEQAWKAERARQAEAEAGQLEAETRQARRKAEEFERDAEAKRRADERIHLALQRAKRVQAEVATEAGEKQRSRIGRERGRARDRGGERTTRCTSTGAGGALDRPALRHRGRGSSRAGAEIADR